MRLTRVSWPDLADAFTRFYAGYLLPIRFSAVDLQRRFRVEAVDRDASFLVWDEATTVAGAALCRRDGAARLAAFGIAPAYRRRGFAPGFLDLAVETVWTRGDRSLELEVFAQNTAARRVYEEAGFEIVGELLGFERPAEDRSAPVLRPFIRGTPRRLAAQLAADLIPDLPWQLEPASLRHCPPPWRVVSDGGGASALVNFSRPEAVELRMIYTPPEARGRGQARRLVHSLALAAEHRPLHVPQLIPARLGLFAQALGFRRASHHQLRMRMGRALDAG